MAAAVSPPPPPSPRRQRWVGVPPSRSALLAAAWAACALAALLLVAAAPLAASPDARPTATYVTSVDNQTWAALRQRLVAAGLAAPAVATPAVAEEQAEVEEEEGGELELERGGDGGTPQFSSLDSMLQWAIVHADPNKLRASAGEMRRMTNQDLLRRRAEIRAVMESMRMPSDAELMTTAIEDLRNASCSPQEHHDALQELLVLVEPIDNANDLHKLGGLAAVAHFLDSSNATLRASAAWVLGKAAQNNPIVQAQLLEEGLVLRLLAMLAADDPEEAAKGLYGLSAAIRNAAQSQEAFYAANGTAVLAGLLAGAGADARLCRKAAFLVADLAEQARESAPPSHPLADATLLRAVLGLTLRAGDIDLQEKALTAVRSLQELGPHVRASLRERCGASATLERMGVLLQEAAAARGPQAELVAEVEALRVEVVSRLHDDG